MPAAEIEVGVLVAVGLSFPKFEDGDKAARVPYRLNKVALRSMGLITDQEDDDDEDEFGDGVHEDGRVGRDAANVATFDHGFQFAILQQFALDVVIPDGLTELG